MNYLETWSNSTSVLFPVNKKVKGTSKHTMTISIKQIMKSEKCVKRCILNIVYMHCIKTKAVQLIKFD